MLKRTMIVAAAALFLVSGLAGGLNGPGQPGDTALAQDAFSRWVEGLWPQASKRGVSRRTFERAFNGVAPDPKVIERANYQPEFVKPIWEYLERATSEKRLTNGRAKLVEHASLLQAIETRYGVDRYIVLAIWGMETAYGEFLGDHYVIQALATLAYQGRRKRYGHSQLMAALKVLERGDTVPARMRGSWAGAMGHTQFIPTTYAAYAVDFNKDGRRDIWDTIPDALASTANYLRVSRWTAGLPWGYEVILPKRFSVSRSINRSRTIRDWRKLGLTRADGRPLIRDATSATLLLPAGAKGPAFLTFSNFRSILRYNNATAYALAVGHLADRLRGDGPFVTPWPVTDRPLGSDERLELQRLLAARGLDVGTVDGVIGAKTEAAIRSYQASIGVETDGYAGKRLLDRLRGK